MSSEALLSNIIPFAGSGLLGYAMGFALKKVLKWVLIIVGFLAGLFFVGAQLLQKYGYVSTVHWDKLGNDTSTQIQQEFFPRLLFRILLNEMQCLRTASIFTTALWSKLFWTDMSCFYILLSNFIRIPYFGRSVISGFSPTL
jgi:uncharacterized membrane protein (Fun14 family)